MPTATDIITDVRDLIGDPVYDASGNPQPYMDGQFLRAQTIVRWINQSQSILGQALKGIEDWTAFPSIPYQDIYTLDPRFFNLESGLLLYDGLVITGPPQVAEMDLLPTQDLIIGLVTGWSISRTAPPMRIRLWPSPSRTPGSSTLSNTISATDTSIVVVSAASFNAPNAPNYGWLRIGSSELVRYQSVNYTTNTFSLCSRAQGGTKAVSHIAGSLVEEANIWVKGSRLPTPIALPLQGTAAPDQPLSDPGWASGSFTLTLTDQLEIPDYMTHVIIDWCLRRARVKENDHQAADALLRNFNDASKVAGGARRRPRMGQARVPGTYGGLWYGRVIIP